jgi:hypothetical protein
MYNRDVDIIETFNDMLGTDMYFHLMNSISDYDLFRLAIQLLKDSGNRLDSDLNNIKILEEYYEIKDIVDKLENIKDNYV